jgi:hypothetical protein
MRSMQDISKKTLVTVLAVAAMAPATVAGAASPGQKMRSADTRDAAAGIVRSPGHPSEDPRSPDARQPGELLAGAEPGASTPAADADTWTTPAILGGGLALLVVASAGAVLYSRRHAAPLPR